MHPPIVQSLALLFQGGSPYFIPKNVLFSPLSLRCLGQRLTASWTGAEAWVGRVRAC